MLSSIDRASIIRWSAIFMIIAGALLLIGGGFLLVFALLPRVMTSPSASGTQSSITLSAANPLAVVIEALVLVIEGGALIFVSRRVTKHHPTARMATVIVTGISALIGLIAFVGGAGTWGGLMLLLSVAVCYFFYADPGIKEQLDAPPPV